MKKIVIAMVLIFSVLINGFAQKTIDQMDGYDWVTMSDAQHTYMIQGYFLSCVTVLNMMFEKAQATMPESQLGDFMLNLERQFLYDETVGQMAEMLDDYYSSPSLRQFTLYRAIPFLAGKEWWNRKTGKVESSLKNGI